VAGGGARVVRWPRPVAAPCDPKLVLSFRPALVEALAGLLDELGWAEAGLADALAEVLTGIARHREEGKRLFPTVFLTHSLDDLLATVGGCDPLRLGRGPVGRETVGRALKQCAPLGEGRSWVMFLLLEGGTMRYGVFRTTGAPTDPTAFERLRAGRGGRPTALGIVQVADGVLEVRGSGSFYRYVHLSGATADLVAPMDVVREFIRALAADVPAELREPMGRLYYRVLIDVIQNWHGALAVVLRPGCAAPPALGDGVFFDPPVDLTACVRRFIDDPSYAVGAEVQAQTNLIRGMLGADGVLVFRSDGCLLGYNVFVRHEGELALATPPVGGARLRTFEYLRRLVGAELVAAFYRSQDGTARIESSL
jgi:hypothetical protein